MPLDRRAWDELVVSCALPAAGDPFAELSAATRLESVGKGRTGAVLCDVDASGGVPLVRTTTRYAEPAQRFRPVHTRLARDVQRHAGLPVGFDNALVECYTNAYKKMGSHSDQALDLRDDGYIAVYSCYEHPEAAPQRKLVFTVKDGQEEGEEDPYEIPLTHHSVVAFSVAANRRLKHRIVWDAPGHEPDNRWLGVTFRTSKTRIRFSDGHAHLPDGTRLTLADEDQSRAFYRLRRRENDDPDFTYPPLTYTLSPSDLLPPV
ncbi:hypothetical protein [Streptomyces sp. NPDC057854]|uniref:hypothetical protein n=1 Tax=unclassified Streptomyces TaxID=2593676 RepID=UPI003679DF71